MKKLSYFLFCLLIIGMGSCKKDDGPYIVTKEITVAALSDSGGKMPFVEFALFDTHEDWRKDSNAIVRARTGKDGEFVYVDDYLEYGKKYYFDLGLDLVNNWKKEIDGKITDESYSFVFPEEPKRIRRDITVGIQTGAVVSETYYDIFVGDSIKSEWEIYQLTINGVIQDWTKVDSCLKDNKLIFYKDFEVLISEGNNICSGNKPAIYSQYIPATPNNSFIQIDNWPLLNDHYGEVYLVQNLKEIVVEYNQSGNLYMHFYKKKE